MTERRHFDRKDNPCPQSGRRKISVLCGSNVARRDCAILGHHLCRI